MTEQAQPQQSPSGTGGDTRGRVEKLLPDILGLMGYPARLEFRDASDGSLAVALRPGEDPGEVGTRGRLGQQLAPDLVAAQQLRDPVHLLRLTGVGEQSREHDAERDAGGHRAPRAGDQR